MEGWRWGRHRWMTAKNNGCQVNPDAKAGSFSHAKPPMYAANRQRTWYASLCSIGEYDTMFVATHWVSRPWAGFICSRPCCFEKLAVDSVLINSSLKFFRRNLLLLKEWLKQTKMFFTQPHVMLNLFDFHLWNIKVLHNCILYTIKYVQWELKSSLKVAHTVCALYFNESYKGLWQFSQCFWNLIWSDHIL